QLLYRRRCAADGFVREDELGQVLAVIGPGRFDGGGLEAFGLGSGIGIEGSLRHSTAAGPEAMTDDLVRVGLARDSVRTWPRGGLAPREPGHRQIKASPEKVNRTALPDEVGAEVFEHRFDGEQDPPEVLCCARVV